MVLLVRSGETRVLVLTGLLACLAAQQGGALWQSWGHPAGLDPATGAAAAGLAAGALGLLAVFALGRTIRDLDRAEALHWDSMEGVRGLTELAARRDVALEERLPVLLEMGAERFGLDVGLVSRVRDGSWEVLAIHAPEDFPVATGARFDLDETWCRHTLTSERPVALGRVADVPWSDPPAHPALRFSAYLAAAIRTGEQAVGTLVFGSLEPRSERFTATHKDLLQLMAQWIGNELEREQMLRALDEAGPRSGPASPPVRSVPSRRREAPVGSVLRLDAALARLERRIRRTAGERVEVVIEPEPGLHPLRGARLPLDAIVLSLVRRAVDSMPAGGTLTLHAANHPASGVAPEAHPAAARFVTLAVRESGGVLGADALARVFDGDGHLPEDAVVQAETALAPSSIRRMIQRAGGDVSVEVEPGRGSTITLFLPAADGAAAAPRATAPGRAPAVPAAGH